MQAYWKSGTLWLILAVFVGCTQTKKAPSEFISSDFRLETALIELDNVLVKSNIPTDLRSVLPWLYTSRGIAEKAAAPTYGLIGFSSFEGVIVGTPARIREYPHVASRVLFNVETDTNVTILLDHGDWYAIVFEDDRLGYIFKDLVELQRRRILQRSSL